MTQFSHLPSPYLRIAACCMAIVLACGSVACASDAETVVRRLPGSDGVLYTLYPPRSVPAGQAGLVVHFYGTGGTHETYNIGRPPYAELRRLLAERGYWIAVPNLGPLHWMNDAACASVDALIAEMVERERIDPARVHLFGTSMGGGSSLIYIMRRPGKIKSAVAVFPMTDFNQWVEEMPKYRPGIEKAYGVAPGQGNSVMRKISPLHHVEAFRETPLFVLHGDADTIVPPHHSRDFVAALGARKYPVTYREVAGEKHRDEIARDHQRELADFLTKADD